MVVLPAHHRDGLVEKSQVTGGKATKRMADKVERRASTIASVPIVRHGRFQRLVYYQLNKDDSATSPLMTSTFFQVDADLGDMV